MRHVLNAIKETSENTDGNLLFVNVLEFKIWRYVWIFIFSPWAQAHHNLEFDKIGQMELPRSKF